MAYPDLVIPPPPDFYATSPSVGGLIIPPPPDAYASRSTYAGFWIRTVAYCIDSIILSTVTSILLPLLPSSLQPFLFLAIPLYFAFCWSSHGGQATLGMRIFSLRVVGRTGSPVSFARALVRVLTLPLSFVVFYLGVLWVAFDPRKQGWHDKLAGTFMLRG